MTTDRGRMHALKQLVENQEVGSYSLPADVLSAYALVEKAGALTVPSPETFEPDQAAAQALAALRLGGEADLRALAARVQEADADRARVQIAQRVALLAVEQAQSAALAVAADRAERVITEYLRPAFAGLLTDAKRAADAFGRYDPSDTRALIITAPAKVRAAYQVLLQLSERYVVLRRSRFCSFRRLSRGRGGGAAGRRVDLGDDPGRVRDEAGDAHAQGRHPGGPGGLRHLTPCAGEQNCLLAYLSACLQGGRSPPALCRIAPWPGCLPTSPAL